MRTWKFFAAFTSEVSNKSVVSFSIRSPKANSLSFIVGIIEVEAPLCKAFSGYAIESQLED